MRKVLIALLFLVSTGLIKGQTRAITETGDEVFLYNDGTWEYLNDSIESDKAIPLNEKVFVKDKKSSFLVKSKALNIGIWINPKVWKFSKGASNDDAEFDFQRKGEDLYGMLISEKMQIPIESFKEIAITNARSAAPDIKIVKEEYRMVNGIKVLMLQMNGTIQGIRISYYGYYYSNPNGTIQLLCYTGESLMDNYMDDMELLLNGLIEL